MGIFTIFGTGLRALNAYSGAMSIVANNIANSSNEDFSRQRVSFETLTPESYGGIETGRGLNFANVSQVVNNVIELRMNQANQDMGENNARTEYLSNVESIFNEVSGEGLSKAVSDFSNAWTAAAAEPENTAARQNLLNSAQSLVDLFNSYGESLVKVRQTVDNELDNLVPGINAKLQEVADLNQKIRDSDNDALALKDNRRKALNELSEMIDITTLETDEGDVQVYLKSGIPLINGTAVATLSTSINVANDNLLDVNYTLGSTNANITDRLQGGRLKGLLQARDVDLVSYQDRLDDLAYTMADQINTLHATGFDLNGNTGNNFFTSLGGAVDDAARRLSLDVAIDGNPNALAFSDDAAEIPGGNEIALSIANLFDSSAITFQDGTTSSFSGYYGDTIALIGNDSSLAQNSSDFAESVKQQIELERTNESGVNVDEEQISLIKLQAAYQASSRLISVADSIIQTLIDTLLN